MIAARSTSLVPAAGFVCRKGYLRVCTYCCEIVLRFAQDVGANDSNDIQTNIQQQLAVTSEPEPGTPAAVALSREQVGAALCNHIR